MSLKEFELKYGRKLSTGTRETLDTEVAKQLEKGL
jgi:hypothetical protein